MNEYRYPFFHWMTGLFLCTFAVVGALVGFIAGVLVGVAL